MRVSCSGGNWIGCCVRDMAFMPMMMVEVPGGVTTGGGGVATEELDAAEPQPAKQIDQRMRATRTVRGARR